MKNLEEYFKGLQQYHTGANVSVFIDNIYLDEVTMIGWRSVRGDTPLYSYNEQLFNAIATGNYRVEGRLAINYVTTGYMEYILAKASQHPANASKVTQLGRFTYEEQKHKTAAGGERKIKEGDIVNDKYVFDKFKAGVSVGTVNEVRTALRNYLWGNKEENISSLGSTVHSMMEDYYFNVMVIYGNPNSENYTMHNIINAKIIDVSQEVAADGTPIQEIYTFIAQDMDKPLFTDHPVRDALAAGYTEPPIISPSALIEYIQGLSEKFIGQNLIAPVLIGTDDSKFLRVIQHPLAQVNKNG